MDNKEEKKQLVVDIDINLHSEIKKRAATRAISLRKWVTRALLEAIKAEDKHK